MKKFFSSMFSEGGKISHKRVISVCAAMMIMFMAGYATFHYESFVVHIFDWLVVFVLVMSGVATIPQILSLVRGTPLPKEDETKPLSQTLGSKPGEEGRPDKP